MQTGNTDFINRNKIDKACFRHDAAYGKSKDLAKRTQLDKGDPKYDGYQRGLASMTSFLIKVLVEMVLVMNQIISLQMHLIDKLLKHLREEKSIHLLETIFGVLT